MGFRELCVGLMMMMILLKPISGRDAVLVLRSNATYQCNGLLGGCVIREELESELDLLMIDSTVIRILQQGSGHISIEALNANKAAAKPCPENYSNCITKSKSDSSVSAIASSQFQRHESSVPVVRYPSDLHSARSASSGSATIQPRPAATMLSPIQLAVLGFLLLLLRSCLKLIAKPGQSAVMRKLEAY
ncbi:hypothetical protein GOBAR_DD36061 [Gossypium barbadense]|nr:hypothetical protein GOBAR_DD36061 [Gossypium barbadense]